MTIIQTKTCAHCGASFDITQSDMDFYAKISPKFGDYVAEISTPTLCPDCRQRRRLAFRNERKLYRRTCDATQKEIISIYSPDKPYTVYDQKVWRGDARNPLDYGRDFDFSRTFTEQFGELMREVPLPSQFNTNGENSDYCNHVGDMVNCYLCSATWDCKNSLYCSKGRGLEYCLDVLYTSDSQHSYELINCVGCFSSQYLLDCESCSYSSFLINCHGCSFCYMSEGLVNQQYVYMNQQLTEDEYKERIVDLCHGGWSDFNETFPNLAICREDMIVGSENCLGHKITNSSNCNHCYGVSRAHGCSFVENGGLEATYVYDGFGFGYNQELCYEIVDTGIDSFHNIVNLICHNGHDVLFSSICYHSSHLFGCIGLRNQEYCIFNKQYTKESYELLVPRIIEHMKKTGEWGEFFHPSLSPFGYNETVANEYFPVQSPSIPPSGGSSDAALPLSGGEGLGVRKLQSLGYKRSDYEAPIPHADKIIPAEKLPTDITVIPDDITNRILRCSVSGKPYRIIPQELAFYRKHGLPIPTKHPDVRHEERMNLRR